MPTEVSPNLVTPFLIKSIRKRDDKKKRRKAKEKDNFHVKITGKRFLICKRRFQLGHQMSEDCLLSKTPVVSVNVKCGWHEKSNWTTISSMCQTVDHTDSRSGPYMAVGPHISNATCQQEAVRVTSEKAKKKKNQCWCCKKTENKYWCE